jgi:MFS family permease
VLNLSQNPAFIRLWIARAISSLGSKVTATALPLTAAITLHATPGQMGALVIAGQLPDLLFGLLAGSWVDRGHHRRFLVSADLGRALLLASIPAGAVFGFLTFPLLLATAFGSGALTVFFTVASVAILPSIVPREQFVDANARLSLSDSVVTLGGPGLAGTLIQFLSAPKAIFVDALSYLASAGLLRGMVENPTPARAARSSMIHDIRSGLHELIATPLLRALTLSSAIFAAGLAVQATVLMLFFTRTLALAPATIGLILACGGAGSLLGGLLAQTATRHIGAGPAMIGGTLTQVVVASTLPLSESIHWPIALLAVGQLVNGIGVTVYSVNHVSLRQHVVRPEMLGRITAGRRFLTFCVAPVGAVLGARLAEQLGLGNTLYVAALLLLAGALVMWASPVARIRLVPTPASPCSRGM